MRVLALVAQTVLGSVLVSIIILIGVMSLFGPEDFGLVSPAAATQDIQPEWEVIWHDEGGARCFYLLNVEWGSSDNRRNTHGGFSCIPIQVADTSL